MKFLAKHLFLLAFTGLLTVSSAWAQGKSGKDKVDLIHNGHTISVAQEAVPAHLAHGDQPVEPPPATTYTVTVRSILQLIGTSEVVTYTQTVPAGGSCTFTNIFGPFTLFDALYGGDATISEIGPDVVFSNVQSDVNVTYLFVF